MRRVASALRDRAADHKKRKHSVCAVKVCGSIRLYFASKLYAINVLLKAALAPTIGPIGCTIRAVVAKGPAVSPLLANKMASAFPVRRTP